MTKIIAHRGSKGTHPENTLAAYREAVRVGSDGIELDVHVTKDGELVVIHDETIDRTTNGHGAIQDLTLAQIKSVSAGEWFGESFKDEKIPTLQEVFDLLLELQFTGLLNIELKTDIIEYEGIVEKCVALQEKMSVPFSICYSSFNPKSIIHMKELRPQQEVAFLFEKEEMISYPFTMIKPEAWHPDIRLLHEAIQQNTEQLPFRVWTVNTEPDMKRCFELQIEAIFTDYPEKAIQLQKELG